MSRTDYNDLGDTFQTVFKEVADQYFNINKDESLSGIKSKIGAKIEAR